jgi:acetyl-CoA carboxylase biotin carboxyl carrier protein
VATDVKAHITGTVWKIEAKPGTQVNEGATVIILEAVDEGKVLAVIDEG